MAREKPPTLKYSFKTVKDKDGKEGYQYTGTQKDGTTFTSKKYSTEQSARSDVRSQSDEDWLKKQRVKYEKKYKNVKKWKPKAAPKATTPKTTPKAAPKKKKAIGGRSPRMDKLVKKYGPSMRKAGSSQYKVATMAKNVVEGGDVESWRKRYKMAAKPTPKPKPKPKKRVIGHEQTSTWSGKASDVRKPTVKRKKIYSE